MSDATHNAASDPKADVDVREEALFAAALERPTEKRSDFLDGACLDPLSLLLPH